MRNQIPRKGPAVSSIHEEIALSQLKPHPRNYQKHPQDQLDHIKQSITDNGFYRHIVVANDYTILAGHGVTEAARQLGFDTVPVIRLPIGPESSKALKIMTGDNEINNLAEVDDRLLTELLKEILHVDDSALLGTGFNDEQLALLAMVSRPASEIADFDEAAEWVGMPTFENDGPKDKLIVHFESEDDKLDFAASIGYTITNRTKYIYWPDRERRDIASLRWDSNE
jgi:hypothetical protein